MRLTLYNWVGNIAEPQDLPTSSFDEVKYFIDLLPVGSHLILYGIRDTLMVTKNQIGKYDLVHQDIADGWNEEGQVFEPSVSDIWNPQPGDCPTFEFDYDKMLSNCRKFYDENVRKTN